MKLILTLKNVGGSRFFLASGKRRPDSYRFERVKGQEHLHQLIVPGDKAREVLDDLALRLQQLDVPVDIGFEIEDADRDSASVVAQLRADLETATETIENLSKPGVPAVAEPEAIEPRRSDEELKMLDERDKMLEILTPFAEGDETPLQVLERLVRNFSAPVTTTDAETPTTPTPTVPRKRKEPEKKKK